MSSTTPAATTPAATGTLVLRRDADGVATLTLNRPKQFNALSADLLTELQERLDAIATDSSMRVVVIAGSGSAFCPGHDLKETLAHRTPEFVGDLFTRCSRVMLTLNRLPQPVIARVHGVATAAGCQLVAACDLAVASSDARFATSGIKFGLFCATPAVPLSRNVGRKRALEMLLTGDFIDAATAQAWGLVNRVVPLADLDEAVATLARSILDKPAAVIAAGKRLFYEQIEQDIETAYRSASRMITANALGDEAREGITAFMEKRAPKWGAS